MLLFLECKIRADMRLQQSKLRIQEGGIGMARILNFGSLNIDDVYHLDHFVRPGETITSWDNLCMVGGKGLNQSIALARAGTPVYHAGKIGQDGKKLSQILEENGVDIGYLDTNGSVTGHAIIQVEKSGNNCIILYAGANREIIKEDIKAVLDDFSEGDFLLLQNEVSNLPYLIEYAADRGITIFLNPSPMDDTILQCDLSKVAWLILNEVEGEELTGSRDAEEILQKLLVKYPKQKLVLTLGAKGAIYRDNKACIRQKSYPVNAVDTTAAGDAFTGYLISGIFTGEKLETALDLAARAAAITVTKAGASNSIPWMSQVMSYNFSNPLQENYT